MDGKGRWIDNVFIERLWRSVKYEEVYLKAYDTGDRGQDRAEKLLRLLQHPPDAPVAWQPDAG
jgi:putative transposase